MLYTCSAAVLSLLASSGGAFAHSVNSCSPNAAGSGESHTDLTKQTVQTVFHLDGSEGTMLLQRTASVEQKPSVIAPVEDSIAMPQPDRPLEIAGSTAQVVTSFAQVQTSSFRFWGRNAAILNETHESKIPEIYPPSGSDDPYNLKDASMDSYSQMRQDLILLPILSKLGNGFFVESGALDGEFHSNTLMYEKSYNWRGLLVEPDPRYIPDIKLKHRRAYLFDGCLSPSDNAMQLSFEMNDIPGQSKISTDGLWEVEAQPLHVLLEAIGQKTVDFWSLDIEGSEGIVLQHTDFSKFEVGIMLVETDKNDDNNAMILDVMNREGFVVIGVIGIPPQDTIFANPKYFEKRNMTLPTGAELAFY